MAYETLKLHRHETVLTITVNRPEVLNAQSRIMLEEFDHMQDPFALRLAKFSVNQMQDEMGFRNGITGAFQSYALTRMYRRDQGEQSLDGAARARQRDEAFGDNR